MSDRINEPRELRARVSGIVVDLCKGHGVWFDANELQGILTFVAHGGLDRMRESDAEFKRALKKGVAAGAGLGDGSQVVSPGSRVTRVCTSISPRATTAFRCVKFLELRTLT